MEHPVYTQPFAYLNEGPCVDGRSMAIGWTIGPLLFHRQKVSPSSYYFMVSWTSEGFGLLGWCCCGSILSSLDILILSLIIMGTASPKPRYYNLTSRLLKKRVSNRTLICTCQCDVWPWLMVTFGLDIVDQFYVPKYHKFIKRRHLIHRFNI